MQVSLNWLRDYIDIDCSAEELAEKLTMAGIPVENLIREDAGLEKVVTGRIEKLEKHPDSDHMWICQMNVGKFSENLVQIVTGAQNVHEGDIVPVAMVGADLPCGKKISKGKLRGVASNGMLCSPDELNVEGGHDGILILPRDTEIGIQAGKILGKDDVIFEFELTANRGDCFSVEGLIREIGVLTEKDPKYPDLNVVEDDSDSTQDLIKIEIADPDLCSRFSARVLKNVKLGESPEWMKRRLEGAGIRSINNVVDVTNFVMVELGQPMHAYDYDQIAGKILTARKSVKGEQLHTLDDSNRLAKGDELVIADSEKAAGLAGIMGGLETEITESTTTVVLEAANFNSASIRRTSRSVGLHSEASGRFERGVDISKTIKSLDRAAKLLQDMNACTVTHGIVDCYPVKKSETSIDFTCDKINSRLGTQIAESKILEILKSLDFVVENLDEDGSYRAIVPTHRINDVKVWEDLSEEIARIVGYDQIPSTLPFGDSTQGHQSERQDFIDKIRQILTSLGMCEELSFGFTNPETLDKLQVPGDSYLRNAIPIMNPLTDEFPLVRTTLLGGILENASRNFSRKNEAVRLFEVAPVFIPKSLPITELPREIWKLTGILFGRRDRVAWNSSKDELDFFDAKGIVEELLSQLSISNYQVERGDHFALHPGRTAFFKKGREIIATVGEVHPNVLKSFGISKRAFIFEMDIEILRKYIGKNFKYESLPRFPGIVRDIAMLVDENIPALEIEQIISKNGGKFFQEVTLFDLYQGKQISEGKKSLAFTIKFQSPEKTLTDEEVDESFQNILAAVEKKFNAELRG